MTEKAYKVMGYTGAASLAVGIVMIVVGVVAGVVMMGRICSRQKEV